MDRSIISGEREYWIDWAKAIGIWLVVLGHLPFVGRTAIFTFHMPFFFALSGYLYNPLPFLKELKKSSKRLILPYFVYSFVLYAITFMAGDKNIHYIRDIIIGNQECLPDIFRPLWFLVSLFVIRCLFSLSNYINPLYVLIGSIGLFLLSMSLHNIPNVQDIFQLQTSIMCLPFFWLGYWLNSKQIVLKYSGTIRHNIVVIAVLSVSLLLGILNAIHVGVNVFRCDYGRSVLAFYVTATLITSCLILLFSWHLNIRNSLICDISKGTLLIVGMHQFVIEIVMRFFQINSIIAFPLSFIIVLFFWTIIRYVGFRYPAIIGRF